MIDNTEIITITRAEYESLLDADHELSVFYANGVDNWEGYDEALKQFHEEREDAKNGN